MGAIPKNRDLPTGFIKREKRLVIESKEYDKKLMNMSDEELFKHSRHLRKSVTNILKSIHVENNISKEENERSHR